VLIAFHEQGEPQQACQKQQKAGWPDAGTP